MLSKGNKRGYNSAHIIDFNSGALKNKVKEQDRDSKKFPGLSSIHLVSNKFDNDTSVSAYNMLGKNSEMRSPHSPLSLKKQINFEEIEEEKSETQQKQKTCPTTE